VAGLEVLDEGSRDAAGAANHHRDAQYGRDSRSAGDAQGQHHESGRVKMPFKAVVNSGAKERAEQTITEVKINPEVAEAAYQKP
jgi:hypothetical protein